MIGTDDSGLPKLLTPPKGNSAPIPRIFVVDGQLFHAVGWGHLELLQHAIRG